MGGTVTCSNAIATFTLAPGTTLAYGTTYTGTITTGAKSSVEGVSLPSNYVWTFTTAATSVLTVVGFPAQGALVSANTPITATFNMAMDCTTLQSPATSFTVTDSSGPVLGTVGCANNIALNTSVATFRPTGNGGALPASNYNRTYTATITTTAKSSVEGVSLPINYVWSFTVIPPVAPAPTVILAIPANKLTGVPLNQVVIADFSEPMAPGTISGTSNFTLTAQGSVTPVSGGVSYVETGTKDELVFQLSPNVFLQPSTLYTATILNAVTNLAGTALNGGIACDPILSINGNCVWTFTTVASGVNNAQPVLVATVPANGATTVCVNPAISATFSEAMNPQTFTQKTFYLYATGSPQTLIGGTYSQDSTGLIETFTPTPPLADNTSYTVTVTDGATNTLGIGLLVNATGPPPNPWTFTLGTSACPSPVNLGVLAPFGGFGGSAGMTNMGTATVINGDIGTTGASTTMTGFHDDYVLPVISAAGSTTGCTYSETLSNIGLVIAQPVTTPPGIAIFTAPGPPTSGCLGEGTGTPTTGTYGVATAAEAQALIIYNQLQSVSNGAGPGTNPTNAQVATTLVTGVDLGGQTLYPGVYWAASYLDITNGDLTLDAQNDPTATFIFQIGSALTVGKAGLPVNIILAHGAKASNIYWLCASAATINGGGGPATFNGTVIADTFISTGTGPSSPTQTVNGRLISMGLLDPSASTTIVDTVINVPNP